mmetsp:Transcript_6596/g.12706  ORF Transcript_6596/g.12706 Transcript_6596/m.12706 type:complete len:200 (-) Transcript_6596:30-629(-)
MPNIHGLHSNERKDDSDNDEETRYVGGADGRGGGSGLAVLPSGDPSPSSDPFSALRSSAKAGQAPASSHKVTMWQNGFTVDGGPLRLLSDPANKPFLTDLVQGRCPQELMSSGQSPGDVELGLEDRRGEEYVPPAYYAFGGSGNTLKPSASAGSEEDTAGKVPASLGAGTGGGEGEAAVGSPPPPPPPRLPPLALPNPL